eukprot:CAMPEP_0114425110 /NCGR_PEP_ID=MMETSP0103-20121206/7060_1 /TAXON_ID=37642 ORGANISM="Paraphysomonas imperforata, Strain PA2" /NCGR_SAMPLE_ID=MMETSP0103 /ASSEMBLY_ACC=CAM_ASM_000201 /LENGTH=379 /DNA_ID=CAMNT_0001593923 /DNA_START=183 /DNA_END=1322 /DNA_ORIENTATION=-
MSRRSIQLCARFTNAFGSSSAGHLSVAGVLRRREDHAGAPLISSRGLMSSPRSPPPHMDDDNSVTETEPAPEVATGNDKPLSDLQIHLDFLRQGRKDVLRLGEGGADTEDAVEEDLLFHLQHPLLRKYNLDMAAFSQNSTEALNSVFGTIDSAVLESDSESHTRSCPSLLAVSEAFSEHAFSSAQDVVQGKVGIDDVRSRMRNDLDWFEKFGLNLKHSLSVVAREVSFGYVKDVKLYMSASEEPTEESIWGRRRKDVVQCNDKDIDSNDNSADATSSSDRITSSISSRGDLCEQRHVHAVVNAVYQLRSSAALNYFMPGPPRYDLSELKDESVALLHVRFIGCISQGEALEWQVARLAVVQLWPPSVFGLLKGILTGKD